MSANSIIDSIWVAGLGSGPLAAIGYVSPLYLMLVGIGNGLGAGANSLISRFIGKKDDNNSFNAGIHSLLITILVTIVLAAILLIFLKPILLVMGASSVLKYAMDYGLIIILGTFTQTIPALFSSILRSEGDVKRATIPLFLTAVLNIILDPIFIYVLNMGVKGAAIATVLSGLIGLILYIYWFFIKKNSFIRLEKKYFNNNLKMYKEILSVGIPASIEQVVMSITSILINAMLTISAGTTAVAVYTAGWRLIQIGIMPAAGIGTAAITIAGVAYGQKNYEKLNTTINYSAKIGIVISVILALTFFIFSNQLAFMFSYSSSSANLAPFISQFIRIICLFLLPVPLGIVASSILQALGKGTQSLILTTNRNLILDVIFAAIAAFILSLGAVGIYWAIVIGDTVGSIIAFVYVKGYIKRLKNTDKFNQTKTNIKK